QTCALPIFCAACGRRSGSAHRAGSSARQVLAHTIPHRLCDDGAGRPRRAGCGRAGGRVADLTHAFRTKPTQNPTYGGLCGLVRVNVGFSVRVTLVARRLRQAHTRKVIPHIPHPHESVWEMRDMWDIFTPTAPV